MEFNMVFMNNKLYVIVSNIPHGDKLHVIKKTEGK